MILTIGVVEAAGVGPVQQGPDINGCERSGL